MNQSINKISTVIFAKFLSDRNKTILLSLFIFIALFSFAQPGPVPIPKSKPKLIIGIVIDQMRADYITKYWDKFGDDGFKKLVNQGYFCKNTNYNYVPTYTGPGHASIYTGTTPCVHGIIGNQWYDRKTGKQIYCSEDKNVKGVGGANAHGMLSPKNLLCTAFGDQLKLASQKGSKVIGIALKDRGAILPAGHNANAAYWFDGETGNWMTSTYYMKTLPTWLVDFNKKELAKKYLAQQWNTLLPIAEYIESTADDTKYEKNLAGETAPIFPHNLPKIMAKNGGLDLIRSTPFGNSFTKDIAIEAIKSESLGQGKYTDMLCVSFSSTDYVGHNWGPQSIEVEDTYLRLDKDIEELLKFVDTTIGKENVLVFLTADHGASETPEYLKDMGIPAGNINPKKIQDTVAGALYLKFSDSLVLAYVNQEFYLDHVAITKKKLNASDIENSITEILLNVNGVAGTVTREALVTTSFTSGINKFVQNGFQPERSGDMYVNYEPGWLEFERTGTSHGSAYPYDTHVPLLWYGWNITPGSTTVPVEIPDIISTLSLLLDVQVPNGCIGKPIPTLTK